MQSLVLMSPLSGDRLPQAKNAFSDGSRTFDRCRDDCLTESPRVRALLEVAAAGISRSSLSVVRRRSTTMARRVLESMRSEFPRFHFVGDDDLLGMLGAALRVLDPSHKDVRGAQRCFGRTDV